jgi:alpha-glucosidase (family GH31 glycosyl hydrolase)
MLIGKSLLVAPIYKDNTNIRTVYLPKKTSWYNLEGKKYQGGLRYTIQSNLREVAPTFLREGSILFLNNVVNVTRVG